jgi:hypothetical protein
MCDPDNRQMGSRDETGGTSTMTKPCSDGSYSSSDMFVAMVSSGISGVDGQGDRQTIEHVAQWLVELPQTKLADPLKRPIFVLPQS